MKTNKKGFTLIELLVVIAIIGILAGIVLVSLGGVRDRAAKSSLQSTMASVTTIASMCEAEGGTVNAPLDAKDGGDPICTGVSDVTEEWPTLPTNVQGDYSYGSADNTTITAVEDATSTDVVECDVETGSCTML